MNANTAANTSTCDTFASVANLLALDDEDIRTLYRHIRLARRLALPEDTTDNSNMCGVRLAQGEKETLVRLAEAKRTTVSREMQQAIRLYLKANAALLARL